MMGIINDIDEHIKKTEGIINSMNKQKTDKILFDAFYNSFEYRFCWSSNSIEGNTLSLEETVAVIDFDEVSTGHTLREHTEAINLFKAIKKMSRSKIAIDEKYIKDMNGIICGTDGSYRTGEVFIGSGVEAVYFPPNHEQIQKLMDNFIAELGQTKTEFSEIIRDIAEKHILFERIHPFADGNGRTGRIILNQMLLNYGLLPCITLHTSKYRQAFKVYDRNGETSLMLYLICDGLDRSAQILQEYSQKRDFDQRTVEDRPSVLNKLNEYRSDTKSKTNKKRNLER